MPYKNYNYDPWLHGTKASVLAPLEETEFTLLPPIKMMKSYHCAPVSGEISLGGHSFADTEAGTSFGRLHSQSSGSYDLKKIIDTYAAPRSSRHLSRRINLKNNTTTLAKQAFKDITVFTISLVRALQRGEELDQLLPSELRTQLLKDAYTTLQVFHLPLVIGKHIHPNFEQLNKLDRETELNVLTETTGQVFNYNYFMQQIQSKNINVEEIYQNPNEESLQNLLEIFELPKNHMLKIYDDETESCMTEEHAVPQFDYFTLEKKGEFKCHGKAFLRDNYLIDGITSNKADWGIEKLLKETLANNVSPSYYQEHLAEKLPKYIQKLNERIKMLADIFENPEKYHHPEIAESEFFNSEIPLIFILDSDEKLKLTFPNQNEYRATTPLKLGVDITKLATDTEEHRQVILAYLEKHDLSQVKVFLFDSLRAAEQNDQCVEETEADLELAKLNTNDAELKTLDLQQKELTPEYITQLLEGLKSNTTLEELNLSGSYVDAAFVQKLDQIQQNPPFDRFSKLTIHIDGVPISEKTEQIQNAVIQCNIVLQQTIDKLNNGKVQVKLPIAQLPDAHIDRFFAALATNNTVTELDLTGSPINEQTRQQLIDLLSNPAADRTRPIERIIGLDIDEETWQLHQEKVYGNDHQQNLTLLANIMRVLTEYDWAVKVRGQRLKKKVNRKQWPNHIEEAYNKLLGYEEKSEGATRDLITEVRGLVEVPLDKYSALRHRDTTEFYELLGSLLKKPHQDIIAKLDKFCEAHLSKKEIVHQAAQPTL